MRLQLLAFVIVPMLAGHQVRAQLTLTDGPDDHQPGRRARSQDFA